MNKYIQTIDQLKEYIGRDTYILTRDDIDSITWRLEDMKKYITETYEKRGYSNL